VFFVVDAAAIVRSAVAPVVAYNRYF